MSQDTQQQRAIPTVEELQSRSERFRRHLNSKVAWYDYKAAAIADPDGAGASDYEEILNVLFELHLLRFGFDWMIGDRDDWPHVVDHVAPEMK